jgi:GNAT superfamily N-acetyltransferase
LTSSAGSGQFGSVRLALPSDLRSIVEFNRRLALETEAKELDLATLNRGVTEALADMPGRIRYWIAEADEPAKAIGQAGITREWSDWRAGWIWWLQSVYVVPEFRCRGVFRSILNEIRRQAAAESDVVGLRLYVEKSNHPARSTYRRLGLSPGGYDVYEQIWNSSSRP